MAAAFPDRWLASTLSSDDPNPWRLSLPDERRLTIDQKRAVPGMRHDALNPALGFLDRLDRDVREGHAVEVCQYGPLCAELHEVIGDRTRTWDDAQRLTFVRQVIDEMLRLRAPAGPVARDAVDDDVLGGDHVRAGDVVLPVVFLTHRHPGFWP